MTRLSPFRRIKLATIKLFSNNLFIQILYWIGIFLFTSVVIRLGIIPGYYSIKTDFPNYITASKMFVENQDLSDIYDNREFKKKAVDYGFERIIVSYVPHTPPIMLLYAPLANLPPMTAKRTWLLICVILFIISVFILYRTFKVPFYICWLIAVSVAMPLANDFAFGQAYIFILFMTSLGLYLWKARKYFFAGFVIGLSSAIKPFGLFLIFPAILHKRWNVLTGMLVGLIIPFAVVYARSPEILDPWFKWVLPAMISGEIQNPYDWDFRSFTVILRNLFIMDLARNPNPLIHSPFHFYFWKILLTLLIIHFFSVLQIFSKYSDEIDEVDAASTFLIAALLIAPVTSSYQYVLLIPVLIMLGRRFNRYRMSAVLNIHAFLVFSKYKPIPFIELIYMVFLSIMCYFAAPMTHRRTLFRQAVVWVTPIVILAIIGGLVFSTSSRSTDNAVYIPEMKTTGFPDELSMDGENYVFTEIKDGNYRVNVNGWNYEFSDLKWNKHDQYEPDLYYDRGNWHYACINQFSYISVFMVNQDRAGLWDSVEHGNVIDIDVPEPITSTMHSTFIKYISTDKKPYSQSNLRTYLNYVYEGTDFNALRLKYAQEGNCVYFLEKITDSSSVITRYCKGNTGDPEEIFNIEYIPHCMDVTESGKYAVWDQESEAGNLDLYLGIVDSGEIIRLTNHRARDYSPAFYFDENGQKQYVYFISERGGGLNDGKFYKIDITDYISKE